ncbi:recombinase family protein, partial [Chloroflexota bacterium]
MLTESALIEVFTKKQRRPDEEELRRLPYKRAYIYGRVSSPSQVRDSRESIRELAKLVELAIADGYKTNLNPIEVEEWLIGIQRGEIRKDILEDGEVVVDVRDLGISARISTKNTEGLDNLQQQIAADITGCIYLTEGVSRLSRDQDYILPPKLLKLLRDHKCRIRTPEGTWNPAIDKDREHLKLQFDYAVNEGQVNIRRLYSRKRQKAARGEYVGGPVPPGFIVEIKEREPSGRHIYGKYRIYAPHAKIVERVLQEYIKNGFSEMKTHVSLGGLVYPEFPPKLKYMDRLSSLRKATRIEGVGYRISPSMISSLATIPELIGLWTWGDLAPIPDNHDRVVPADLWLEAFEGCRGSVKPRGRGVRHDPLEWDALLWCGEHDIPQRIAGHASKEAYRCQSEYVQGLGPACFNIASHYLNEPLTKAVL